ncbi:MAG: hypothetical protein QOG62_1021 [Thermoleophilaceae bacterium]|nr:hypothetical protein [Thermoleophilaceae bacterium]MEA2622556.1 hypothetical protein [Chloroflexota bacterium]
MVAARLPIPGPSFIKEEVVELRGGGLEPPRKVQVGMSAPSIMDDGWWLLTLWAGDESGVLEAGAVAPIAGPPPLPPLQVIGPSLAGGLAGFLAQADGRQLIRLRMPPADDETRPWARPLVLMTAITWDPIRASTLRPNELARELLRAFARALEAAGSPA